MAQTLQLLTLIAFIATTSGSSSTLTVKAVHPKLCQGGTRCEQGQLCFEQPSTCIITWLCTTKYTCASVDLDENNQPKYCKATTCAKDHECITGTSTDPQNENTPLHICVHPCWVKNECGYNETCMAKPDLNENKKTACSNSTACKLGENPCQEVICMAGRCEIIDCKPQCISVLRV